MEIHTPIPQTLQQGRYVITRALGESRADGWISGLFHNHSGQKEQLKTISERERPQRVETMRGFYGFSYCIEGSAAFSDSHQKVHPLKAGTFFQFLDAQPMEASLRLKPSPDFFECSVSLDRLTGTKLADLGLWESSTPVIHSICSDQIIKTYVKLINNLEDKTLSPGTLLRRTISLLEQLYSLQTGKSENTLQLEKACAILKQHMEPSFTMPEAAQAIGMGYEFFRKWFKQETGMAPAEYQLAERMNKARILLGSHTVKKTAELLGYTDPYIFSRQCKKVTGRTPKDFRGISQNPA